MWLAWASFLDLSVTLESGLSAFFPIHSPGLRPGFLGFQGPLSRPAVLIRDPGNAH